MWLNILLVLFGWFAGSLALGIIVGKSMASANRFADDPDDLQKEFERNSCGGSPELMEVEGNHRLGSLARKTLLADLHPAKH